MKYDHQKIEHKWQKFWQENKTNHVKINQKKPKYYVLDMFPYPSGAGLHVGHLIGYTATDIITRFKRQNGFNVLHPMGWDSFGLPAEQYAIRTGTHPALTTKKNVDNFRRQLEALGFSYDWDREISTSDPSYYKWTQWIFTKLYEKGLAYEAEMLVNYCPELGTVLANEEVENGRSKEGGYLVERRPLKQWVLKITAYADRLIKDLDLVDWPESLKKLQINWIGKSEGAHIKFPVVDQKESIEVFTTRPDTLFGVTYLVLAPEHPLVSQLTQKDYADAIEAYKKQSASKSDLDRTDLNKDKTGAFTGSYAINPANQEKIPIWIADYVLMGYGTGAIMAVPGHDERDFDFAKVFQLPILPVYDPDFEHLTSLIPPGVNADAYTKEILQGQKCWTGDGTVINSSNAEVNLNGLKVDEAKAKMTAWLEEKGFGKKAITYKLRDWLFSRQRYWGEPFPILHFEDGTKRALELNELPLTLPEINNYKPSGDGQSPLSQAKEWIEITDPKTGKKALRETNTMPNWAGSCWYYLRFCDPSNQEEAWRAEAEKYWAPVDLYIGGVEHAVLHLLYARFWHKVLYDCGFVTSPEPFQALRNQGLMVARSYQTNQGVYLPPEDVEEKEGKYYSKKTGEELRIQIDKMSKSKLNGVSPDAVIEELGADSLRIYEMFLGPLEKEKVWNTEALKGSRRFLDRMYDLVLSEKVSDEENEEASKLGHRLVHHTTKGTELLQFNTAIAKMMEFINDFSKLSVYPKSVLKMAIQCLYPYAPHISSEMWHILGFKDSLADAPYPKVNEAYLEDSVVTYVVQVNGKVRGKFELPKDQTQEQILTIAKDHPIIQKYLQGQNLEKVIFVPNKLLNLVLVPQNPS